ncbi:hypothetical protein EUTSA_v10028295mg [Eutrema salsugineum]|uniref:TIR domain-containing protein n=1 Tax=Eutrema salsugineum TaxID=72664 RepID=V4L9E0_EUTSA|nr:hypothetical protein EUTSA_v10028295mg [Eutrema salsugineum]
MSSSSSLFAERKVDVFLSFCNTTTSHAIFKEKTRVRPIDKQTLEALEESKVAVVMTSETKLCSVGFLEELIVILEFQERGSLTVIPIFLTAFSFDVEEEIYQEYPENAPSWRIALTKLANIAADSPSLSPSLAGMGQSDFLEQIAHIIDFLCLSSTSNDLNGLVAMDRHLKVVHDLLASQVNKEVSTIGIWGRTGVGKTTLARSLDDDGHEITEARRKNRKVLLIVDNVNNIEQGKWIIEYAKWFAPESRVILISQNKNLLVDAGARDLYEVRSLRYDEALQLFSHFAFKQPYPPSDFEQLAVRAVYLAGF